MFGEAEGADGVELGSVLEQGGTFVVELNTFSVSRGRSAARCSWASGRTPSTSRGGRVNLSRRGQPARGLHRAARQGVHRVGRAGWRVGLAVQKPLKYVKELATNIDVWCLFGFGSGAIDELTWASRTTHGMVPPEAFKKQRRTAYARLMRLMRRLGRLSNLMNRGVLRGPRGRDRGLNRRCPSPICRACCTTTGPRTAARWLPPRLGCLRPTPSPNPRSRPNRPPNRLRLACHHVVRVRPVIQAEADQPLTPCNEALYQTLVDEGLPAWCWRRNCMRPQGRFLAALRVARDHRQCRSKSHSRRRCEAALAAVALGFELVAEQPFPSRQGSGVSRAPVGPQRA